MISDQTQTHNSSETSCAAGMVSFSLVGVALATTLQHDSTLLTLANDAGAPPLPNHAPEHPAHRPMSFRRPCFRTQIHPRPPSPAA